MTPQARLQAAIELLDEIAESGRPADGVVSHYMRGRRYIGAKDRRAIVERVYGVLRRMARLDWWLERMDHGVYDGRARLLADLAITDRMAESSLAKMFDGGHHAPKPMVKEERRLVERLHGEDIFHHEMPGWVRGEYPDWIEPALSALFGDRLAAEMGAMRDEAPLDLRVNRLKAADRDTARARLAEDKLLAEPTRLSPWGLRLKGRWALMSVGAFRDGLVEVQDEGSQLVALLTGAKPGEAVADYCAGAGGKTLALAMNMDNKGRLVACDTSEGRVERAKERLRRAGVHNVTRRVLDGESDKWIKRSAGSFDRVLVDAPCSGTGTWRRNPDAKWKLTAKDIEELTGMQERILASAARLVKPGGRLVYATCSLLPAEDEAQVDRFLSNHPGFELVPVQEAWAEALPEVPCPAKAPWLRLTPLQHDTDGFFVAVMRRLAD